jgi:hypothetical protein
MPSSQQIEVTQADIDAGDSVSCWSCPLALAATRAFGCTALAGTRDIAVRTHRSYVHYSLPAEARDFVVRFDRGEPVSPMTFVVERVEETCPP